jgi:hypothetical protein
MAQVVEHLLPSKCEYLNSNPSTTKKKNAHTHKNTQKPLKIMVKREKEIVFTSMLSHPFFTYAAQGFPSI